MNRLTKLIIAGGAGAILLPGCGGGGSMGPTTRTGSFHLTIKWPTDTRLIPKASNSLSGQLLQGTGPTVLQEFAQSKPSGGQLINVAWDNLAPGPVTLTAKAFPGADLSGVAQASGAVQATIVAGQTTHVTLTMASTIDHLLITPANPTVAVGNTQQLTMTAYNAQNEVVLTAPSNVSWGSTVPTKAAMDQNGLMTGMAAGGSQISVQESESGKLATTNVTVTGGGGGGTLGSIFPFGVTYGPDNKIYLTDPGLARVERMDDMTGANGVKFGTGGGGVNQFINPDQMAFDSQGRIYIADTNNDRIVRINDMTGAGWTTYGAPGSGQGKFNTLQGVALDAQDRIYVSDLNNARVVRIDDMNGTNWTTYGTNGTGQGQFGGVNQVYVDKSNGKIYIADATLGRVVRIDDMTGTNWTAFSNGQLGQPSAITLDSAKRIYIVDPQNFRIARFDDMNGTNFVTYGSYGTTVGHFSEPEGIAVDPAGHIYVADGGAFGSPGRLVRMKDMSGGGWITYP